jgi:alpha-amylase
MSIRKLARSLTLPSVLALFAAPAALANPMNGNSQDVMLQGFHWRSHETKPWWGVIRNNATRIRDAGFNMVWLPPSGDSAAVEGYLPRQLYLQTSGYGSQADLQAALGALRTAGVRSIADIVVNHRVGTSNWADFTNPAWGSNAVVRGDEWTGATGNFDTGDGFNAGRDLDHTQAFVRTDITNWMNWLKSSIGYDGWRWDYVKGFAPSYVGQYNRGTTPYFSVGELWTDLNLNDVNPHRQRIMDWINATDNDGNSSTWADRSAAFDFTTKGVLQQAVQFNERWRLSVSGQPPGALGWWGAKSVSFIDNHDTGPSHPSGGQNHWPFPGAQVMEGYAYILTHPGIPSVYWVHYFDWGHANAINALINIRKTRGINSSSTVRIAAAQAGLYAAFIRDGANNERVAVKIGPDAWSPGAGWTMATSGTNYAVWVR